jgi:hypothetical protein
MNFLVSGPKFEQTADAEEGDEAGFATWNACSGTFHPSFSPSTHKRSPERMVYFALFARSFARTWGTFGRVVPSSELTNEWHAEASLGRFSYRPCVSR